MPFVHISPMDLPELRAQVANYLDKPQLAAASVVCKSWNESFIPALYSEIQWCPEVNAPTKDTLLKYGRHARILFINKEFYKLARDAFTKLEALRVQIFRINNEIWEQLSNLLIQNRGLVEISISIEHSDGPITLHADMMRHIMSYPSLRSLGLHSLNFDIGSTEQLLDACLQLQQLSLISTGLAQLHSLERWDQFSAMRSLSLSHSDNQTLQQQLQLIKKCPQLRSLSWSLDSGETFSVPDFCKTLSHDCVLIDNLKLEGWSLSDDCIGKIIDSSTRLTSILLPCSDFGMNAFKSCSRYLSTLTRLDVHLCRDFTSAMSQQILTSCPLLRDFDACTLDARDILGITEETQVIGEGRTESLQTRSTAATREWVCLNLRSLSVFICGLDERYPARQRQVLQQLARLEKLEYLSIGTDNSSDFESVGGLVLRLDAGLDILKSLKRLEKFVFLGLCPEMQENEVHWMLSEWTELRNLGGLLNSLDCRRNELQDILFNSGSIRSIYYRQVRLEEVPPIHN